MLKNVEVDHKEPCGSLLCEEDIGGFVTRLFCSRKKLRVLCKPCHLVITNKQREERKNEQNVKSDKKDK